MSAVGVLFLVHLRSQSIIRDYHHGNKDIVTVTLTAPTKAQPISTKASMLFARMLLVLPQHKLARQGCIATCCFSPPGDALPRQPHPVQLMLDTGDARTAQSLA
jgi:hypothetical protein